MSCTCNTTDPNCQPCPFCAPSGVKCLPDCNPQDPCPDKIDLCCVRHSGQDEPCSDIENGQPLCELVLKFLDIEFPQEECCALEMSIDLLAQPLTTTTTTSTTSTTSTTTSSTSTTSTTTTTTVAAISFCYSTVGCTQACSCSGTTNVTLYSTCSPLKKDCVLYTNPSLTITAPAGYYNTNSRCHIVSSTGVITGISKCNNSVALCYTTDPLQLSSICDCFN